MDGFIERDASFSTSIMSSGRDRLGHRIDPEDRVVLTGTLRSRSAKPCTVEWTTLPRR